MCVFISPGWVGGWGAEAEQTSNWATSLLNFEPPVLSNNREIIGKVCSSVILDTPFKSRNAPTVSSLDDGWKIDRSARMMNFDREATLIENIFGTGNTFLWCFHCERGSLKSIYGANGGHGHWWAVPWKLKTVVKLQINQVETGFVTPKWVVIILSWGLNSFGETVI